MTAVLRLSKQGMFANGQGRTISNRSSRRWPIRGTFSNYLKLGRRGRRSFHIMESNRHDELHNQNVITTGMPKTTATSEPKKTSDDQVDGRPKPKPRSHSKSQRKRKDEGCFGSFMGMLADMMLTTDEDKIEYLKSYNCMPPPIFILVVSITELVVFIYFSAIVETKQWITMNEALLDNVLVYDPYLREQVWRFISYMLLHAGIEHIMGNVLLQLLVGVPLEMVHKGYRVCIVYMSGVLAGSLASSIFDPYMYLVGASGGVYALLGGYLSNILMNWSRMAMNGLHLFLLLFLVLGDFAFSLYRRFVIYPHGGGQQVSFVAHIAGGLAGISIGYVVFSNFNKKLVEDPKFWVCLLSYGVCCCIAVFWNIFLTPVND